MSNSLIPFFEPKGVAIVGASQHPEKLGYGLARNLVTSDYQGAIHFVNPKGGVLFERQMFEGIKDVPDPVDLAVLLVPAPFVAQSIKECGERGIKAVIIASGGFGETGEAGAALESECLFAAKKYGIRLVGPNCIGILDTHFPLDTTFLPPPGPVSGSVAFISHSGAICAAVIDWARGQGFGLSRLVSLGNQIDVNEADVLDPVASDRYTRVITMYLEGVSDGRRFVQEASCVTEKKPVIALKVGRFEAGQQAVASHTGALAGKEVAFNAAFRRAGVIRAETSEEMFDWARALAWSPLPKGRRVAVLTNAGGPGVTAADALESHSMELASLSEETKEALRSILPDAASVHNPVDMLASASPQDYAKSLRILLADESVDSVMVVLPPPPMFTAAGVANAVIPVIQASSKPVVIALMGERLILEAMERLRAAHIPEYRFPERAASALAVLADRVESLSRCQQEVISFEDVQPEKVKKILKDLDNSFDGFLPEETVHEIMGAYRLPILPMQLAKDENEAVSIAEYMGYPVVLKIASPDITHKSDVGGVRLHLSSNIEVKTAYNEIVVNVTAAFPAAEIHGVYIQKMVTSGQEVIIGTIQDAQFGALAMFGSGGIEVEGLKDVAFALAPITEDEIRYLLDGTWAGRKLKGYRNLPPSDRKVVEESLARLSQLASDFPRLAEIEVNPLRVLPEGEGAFALDTRIRITANPIDKNN